MDKIITVNSKKREEIIDITAQINDILKKSKMKKSLKDKVYNLVKRVPKGKVTTYGEIARKIDTKAYRAIGQILKRNVDPMGIPCSRVVMGNGGIGGYSGNNPKDIQKKIDKLRKEGVIVKHGKIDLSKYFHRFDH